MYYTQTLSSFDQFSNFVLTDAVERRVFNDVRNRKLYYHDIPLGLYVVRGDSMVLTGQVRPEEGRVGIEQPTANEQQPSFMESVSLEELHRMIERAAEERKNAAVAPSSNELEWDFDNDLIA